MKTYIKTFLGRFLASFSALVVFSGLSLILILISLILIPSFLSKKPDIKLDTDNSYILSLHSDMLWSEYTIHNTANKLKTVLGKSQDWGISDFEYAIKQAKNDSNISAIYIELGFNPNSFATIYAMRKNLMDFKQSGKKIYAFGRIVDQKSYLLATVADSIFMSEEAEMLWDGMGKNSVFFKGFLDKIGLDMQIFYAGKFKSATEPFRRNSMSEENKLQQSEILKFFHDSMLANISSSRHISTENLNKYADNLILRSSKDAKNLHFIDGVKSWEELDVTISKNNSKKTKRLDIKKYLSYKQQQIKNTSKKSQIAIIYADGDIVANGTGNIQDQAIEGIKYAKCIRDLAEKEEIKGVVLRINSPGGSVSASEEIYDALQHLRKFKPVVVSFGSVAASGGYYIACASDYIIADPYCITGSIGVFAMIPNIEEMLHNKLNLGFDGIKTNENTFMGSNLTLQQRSFLQAKIEKTYAGFKLKVARARGLSLTEVEKLAQGRVWTAPQALKLRLIDQLGSLEQAINKVASLAKLTAGSYSIENYPEYESFLEQWFSDSHYGIKLWKLWKLWNQQEKLNSGDISGLIAESYDKWSKISRQPVILMRMPYDIQP